MMPHLVLRPSTRLPFTWCSWSAPTTANGIFSCGPRGARSPQGATALPPAPKTPAYPHPNHVVEQPVIGVLVKVLLWVHADGVGLQVLLDLRGTGCEMELG